MLALVHELGLFAIVFKLFLKVLVVKALILVFLKLFVELNFHALVFF